MSNAFSVGSVLLIVLAFLIPNIEKFRDKIVEGLLIIAFFCAGFYAWRNEKKNKESTPILEVTYSLPELLPKIFHGPALGKASLSFDLDLCNVSSELCVLDRPILEDFILDSNLFKTDNLKYQIRLKNQPHERPTFPFKIPSKDRNIFTIQVEMESTTRDPKVIASELRQMNKYSFLFKLNYRFISTNGEKEERIVGNFEPLIQSILKHWENNRQFEYLYAYNSKDE
jgi:hypothetical protein